VDECKALPIGTLLQQRIIFLGNEVNDETAGAYTRSLFSST